MDTEICIHLQGAKCAKSYCPYWSTTFKKCSFGVEAEKRAEFWDILVAKIEKTLDEAPEAATHLTTDLLREARKVLH